MMKLKMISILLVFIIALLGCRAGEGNESVPAPSENDDLKIMAEVTEGDFIYRLVTDQEQYLANEPVRIYAELEYKGKNKEITIYHAASPFSFPMYEKTRSYSILYMMDQPLVSTILTKGKPFREEYKRSGGYGSQDEKAYIDFMKDFLNNGFPDGHYVMSGYADFYVEAGGKSNSRKDYKLEAQISFEVLGGDSKS